MKEIDYERLVKNLKTQINILEYDSARSAGKCMTNANTLDHMWALLDRYTAKAKTEAKPTAAKKPAAK